MTAANGHRTNDRGELIDALNRTHHPARGDVRIVSLVPSLTELLFSLGLGDAVVGRTSFCIHPAGCVDGVQRVGGTKKVDLATVRRLRPTHVLVNVDETPKALAEALEASGTSVVVTHPIEVSDNIALVGLLGALFDREEAAADLCARFNAAYERVVEAARAWPPRRVLYLIWQNPWMSVSADTYVSRMLALANIATVADDPSSRYPVLEIAEAILDEVDDVMFSSEPFPFNEKHVEAFAHRWPRHSQKAIRVDGELLSWYGSRAVAGLDYLRRLREGMA